jgi:CRISPR-associated protein Cas1
MQDLHELPKLRDSISYLYVERAVVDRDVSSIKVLRKEGRTQVPAAALSLLMLGPGTSVTHAAMKLMAENGCSVLWAGEEGMRLYAQGLGETRRAYHLLRQAELVCDPVLRTAVVRRMYEKRFGETLADDLELGQIRGMEGARMRQTYARFSRESGVRWSGRRYDRSNWSNADPINRALSAANALLNGLCHAAIVSGGYSPALGFIHTGRLLSFVYDIADLYKTELTIPIAFETIRQGNTEIEKRVRQTCRQRFHETRLLERILPDIDGLLQVGAAPDEPLGDPDVETSLPAPLWDELNDEPGDMAWS